MIGQNSSNENEALKYSEENMFLSNVVYEDFWGKIKLVGYTMQLRPEHMRLISPFLNLDYDTDLLTRKQTVARSLLCDAKFGF